MNGFQIDAVNNALDELRAENARLQAHATSMINAMKAENEMLRALLGKLTWKSIDKDNMEFRCEITCYVMDELRALQQEKA